MNNLGPSSGRDPGRIWALVVLVGIVALTLNRPIQVQISSTERARESEGVSPRDRRLGDSTRESLPPSPSERVDIGPWPLSPVEPAEPAPLIDVPPPLPLDPGVIRAAATEPPGDVIELAPPKPPEPPAAEESSTVAAGTIPEPPSDPGRAAVATSGERFAFPMLDASRLLALPRRTEPPERPPADREPDHLPPAPVDEPPAIAQLSKSPPSGDPPVETGPPPIALLAPPADVIARAVQAGEPAPAPTQSRAAQAIEELEVPAGPRTDDQFALTGCATCGGFHNLADGPSFHDMMGSDMAPCIPGRTPCPLPFEDPHTVIGAAVNNLYQCLCCPDPCYQPHWEPGANASFFADYARPRTVTRFRYDNLENMVYPDRNSFWINQVNTLHTNHHKITDLRARLQQVYIYQEAASARGSFFIEYPYRQINPSYEPTQAGFGDMNFGMKSLLFDCELLQATFQFRTYAPTGSSSLGLGTGHFSLDPSMLLALKLGPETYMQGQYGNWIPLGGPNKLAGGVFYWLTSLNQVLWYLTPNSPLIATLEMDGWSFENGGYTSALRANGKPHVVESGGGVSYFNIGPGLRQSICNRVDFGGALTWATSDFHWAQPWFRFEVRVLY